MAAAACVNNAWESHAVEIRVTAGIADSEQVPREMSSDSASTVRLAGYGISSVEPVVLREARSLWACAASFRR